MQISLPKLLLAVFLILIALLGVSFFLLNRGSTIIPSSTNKNLTVNSNVNPYIVKSLPLLQGELNDLGFWSKGARSNIIPKKLTVNVNYGDKINDPSTLDYSQVDEDGNLLAGGNHSINSKGAVTFDIYISKKVPSLKNPSAWIDSVFWSLYYTTAVGPLNLGEDNFIRDILSKGNYFSISK